MTLPTAASSRLLDDVALIARAAGRLILDIYRTAFATERKSDDSPVTEADRVAEAEILRRLAALDPQVPVVAEEAVAAGRIPVVGRCFWLVDPLDGTREFIERRDEFTVNIARIEDGVPVLGVVYAPALDRLYAGAAGVGAWVEAGGMRRAAAVCTPAGEGLVVVGSRSHGDADALRAYLAGRPIAALRPAGSSLKFCLVAEGDADVYPRLGRTMEWDTAAGQAVLEAAGGRVVCAADGAPLRYGKAGFENPHFVAWGTAA